MNVRIIIVAALLSGCATQAPVRQMTWVAAAEVAPPADVVQDLPIPAGWQVHPFKVYPFGIAPECRTNNAGALISWCGMIEIIPPDGTNVFQMQYLGTEFGPAYYPFLDPLTNTGAAQLFIRVDGWAQPYAPEFRVLKRKNTTTITP